RGHFKTISGRESRSIPYRYPDSTLRGASRLVRCSGGIKSFRRHSFRPWGGRRGIDGAGSLGEFEPRAGISFLVRARAWIRSRYRWKRDREPGGTDLV